MTELSFLIKLLLNEKLQKATRDLIAARIEEVQLEFVKQTIPYSLPQPVPASTSSQCASTQALLAKHPDLAAAAPAVIAHTQAAAAAMSSRNQAIAESMAGKVDKNTGRPRKF